MMKLFIAIAFSLFSSLALAKQTLVVISPHHPPEAAKVHFTSLVELYTTLPLGDTLTVIDGSQGKTIATLSVPSKAIYQHPKARIQAARKSIVALKAFAEKSEKGNRTIGAMNIPHALHSLARHYPKAKDIVFMGISPLHDVPLQLGFNMRFNHYPSDAFFGYPATDNPFGTVGRESLLKGKRIHWQLPDDKTSDGVFKEAVARFWHLYLHQLGGGLVSYTQDVAAVFDLLKADAKPLSMPYTLRKNDKRGMIQVPRYRLDITAPTKAPLPKPKSQSTFKTKQPVTVFIQWGNGDVDLDLYASIDRKDVVFFENVHSDTAKHLKTFGLDERMHYETIKYHQPIDVSLLRVVVNVYALHKEVKPITGMLWIYVGNKKFVTPFEFDVTRGNTGHDAKKVINSGKNSPYSQYFTLDAILNPKEGQHNV